MARPAFKAKLVKVLPTSAERSTYVLASGLCLILIALYWQGNFRVVWHLDELQLPLRVLSLAGWGLTVWATFQIDHFDLFGVKKPFGALSGKAASNKQFVTPFLYRHMRHPIQTGVLLGMWLQAYMTAGNGPARVRHWTRHSVRRPSAGSYRIRHIAIDSLAQALRQTGN